MSINKKIVAVIPARMAASRFPGKPLVKILELPMIEHVRRRVALCEILDQVYVATCDRQIAETVEQNGGKAIMTADTHERCTDRVEESAQGIEADIVVIVQGDEPLFVPGVINALVEPMLRDESVQCANILSRIKNEADLADVNIIKAALNNKGDVLYFSRAPIPYLRVKNNPPMYRQTGLSAFTKSFLHQFSRLSPTPLEKAESIDFLRILEHGFPIRAVIYDQHTIGVDRPQDVEKIEQALRDNPQHWQLYQTTLLAFSSPKT